MKDKTVNRIFAAIVFVFSLVIYYITVAPTVSFWDCGEFIACSYKLAVPHPPGSPLFLLVGRIFTLLPIFADIAKRINIIATLTSALTIMLLYLSIVILIQDYMKGAKEGFLRFVPYFGGMIGALTFAFTNSFWFNAVEAEVYAPSMFFTAIVVWLILYWSTKSEEIGNEKYLLVIAYLVGLSIGVHLLNVLALPTVFMIIYYKKYPLNFRTFVYLALIGAALTALVYPGVVQGVPEIADHVGFFGLLLLILGMVLLLAYSVKNKRHLLSLSLTALLLITIGYSTYLMIYIRSGMDPNIDENDPETIEKFISYLKREQYGEYTFSRTQVMNQTPQGQRYSSPWNFFWKYQIDHMYVRYFFWNFIGKSADEVNVSWLKFLFIPFLLGVLGSYYHFKKDWKHALAIFVLFFMTGIAIVIYLNQPDPQPRERDYSYVGSFFAFSIWIGIGAAAILEWLARFQNKANSGGVVAWLAAIALIIASPIQVLVKNFDEQDRSGNYVASDYSYNMLVSSEPNGVIYTNGDNDTFPLWFLQEVENVRTDVRVANLSLLNTSWYIEQLKHQEPRVPISLSDADIERIMPVPWPKKQTIEINIPPAYHDKELQEAASMVRLPQSDTASVLKFDLGPKIYGRYLRVQDYMILNTLYANKFRKPLYFAVTCASDNMLDGLRNYLRMDGLVFKITTVPGWGVEPDVLWDNLMNKFRYRNLNNPNVYYNDNIIGLLQNYRSAFIQLANYYVTENDTAKVSQLVHRLDDIMPESVIPYINPNVRYWVESLKFYAGILPADSLNGSAYSVNDLLNLGEVLGRMQQFSLSQKALERVLQLDPENYMAKGYLINVYSNAHEYGKAISMLEDWIKKNPNDKGAKARLQEFKAMANAENSGK